MPRRATQQEFIATATKFHGGRYSYFKVLYFGGLVEIIVTCLVHGDFKTTPRKHLKGKGGCIACGGGVKLTQLEFTRRCGVQHNFRYDYSKVVYINAKTPILITCFEHGDFKQVADHHIQGNGCPLCIGRVVHTKGDFLSSIPEKLKLRGYDYSLIPLEFKPTDVLKVGCAKHGEFTTNYNRFIRRANGCRGCSGCLRSNTKEFIFKAVLEHPLRYTYSKVEYINCGEHVTVTCVEHGDFRITPNNHLNGGGCPKCSHQVSSQENRLFEEFPLFNRTAKDVIPPLHLDLYSPKHSLAIEVNGRYWHSENRGRSKNYHLNKTQLCSAKGIRLLHFWDSEIDQQFSIVKSMVLCALGEFKSTPLDETVLLIPTHTDAQDFLQVNSIGDPLEEELANYHFYGLENDEGLVKLLVVSLLGETEEDWRINKLVNKVNTTITGGASKLFEAFKDDYDPKSVVAYANRRYSEGNVYKQVGFEFNHNSEPDYFYTKNATNIPRHNAQKHKLPKLLGDNFDPNVSETQNMLNNNYVKVWDCGNAVFTWTEDQPTT